MLTTQDLPQGWSVDNAPFYSASDAVSALFCGHNPPPRQKLGAAGARFKAGDFGPFLVEDLSSYQTNDAEGFMKDAASSVQSCTQFSSDTGTGSTITWNLTPLQFPNLGDETVAAHISSQDIPIAGSAEGNIVAVRTGGTVVVIAQMAGGGTKVDPQQTETFARTAVGKLPK